MINIIKHNECTGLFPAELTVVRTFLRDETYTTEIEMLESWLQNKRIYGYEIIDNIYAYEYYDFIINSKVSTMISVDFLFRDYSDAVSFDKLFGNNGDIFKSAADLSEEMFVSLQESFMANIKDFMNIH